MKICAFIVFECIYTDIIYIFLSLTPDIDNTFCILRFLNFHLTLQVKTAFIKP